MNENYDVVIIGCGTSCGFLVSFLKEKKFVSFPKILVIEKNSFPFRKLLVTGNGRCNFTNLNFSKENYDTLTADNIWQEKIFSKIINLDLKKYFLDNGILHTYDEYGRVFPYTKSAKTIHTFFVSNLNSLGINLCLNTEVKEVVKTKDGYKLFVYDNKTGVQYFVTTKVLILSFGGKAYPKFGTDGESFKILKKLGHSTTKLLCGIVPLVTEKKDFAQLDGLKMECAIKYKNFYRKGEILFTEYGISGPNVLYVSNLVSIDLQKSDKVVLTIDFLPEKSMTIEFYKKIFYKKTNSLLTDIFGGSLNNDFLKIVSKKVLGEKFDIKKPVQESELERFYFGIRNYKVSVVETKTFDESQVTIGGVDCNEINVDNLESKINPKLYFMGEIIDFTGSCGGYNIHFCAVCGKILAEEIYKLFR
jgi:predicted Rossmann fold flavoprotein